MSWRALVGSMVPRRATYRCVLTSSCICKAVLSMHPAQTALQTGRHGLICSVLCELQVKLWDLYRQLTGMQELAHYWEKEFDWRKAEAQINSFANYEMEVNGIEVSRPSSSWPSEM